MKRARQERASSSSDYNGYGSLSSPRRVMIPLLVRDGKTCGSGMSPTSPHPISYSSSASDIYSGSTSNSRTGYGEELSLYSNPGHASTMSPFSSPLGTGGFGMTYSPEASPQFPVPSQQTRDYLTATYHHQLGSQQYGSAYSTSHLRAGAAAAAAFNSPYAFSASNYSPSYSQHQIQPKCWPTW